MIEQFAIAIFGVSAIWLSQGSGRKGRKWAPVLGLAGQPFWMYATFTAEQWGILILSIFYTLAWMRGIKTQWLRETA